MPTPRQYGPAARPCSRCRRPFPVRAGRTHQRFCSETCQRAGERERAKTGRCACGTPIYPEASLCRRCYRAEHQPADDKQRARWKVQHAVRDGRMTRPTTCEACGSDGAGLIDAHHEDYARPFDVRWLCRLCHNRRHAEQRRREQVAA